MVIPEHNAIADIPCDFIDVFAGQSRETFDEAELANFAKALRDDGQLSPGVAWFDEGRGRFVLICGERRFRGLKLAKKPTMQVKVLRGDLTQAQLLAINIAENIQRENLNPVERAKAFRRFMQLEGATARQVADRFKISESLVSRDLAVLELPAELQKKVASGDLPSSVAASIARLDDDTARRYLADQFTGGKLNRSEVTAAVNQHLKKPSRLKPDRLPGQVGNVSFTLTAPQPLTLDAVLRVAMQLKQLIEALQARGVTDIAALAQALQTPPKTA